MFKRGYLLIEVLVTLTILGVFLPILYNVLIKTVKVGSEIKKDDYTKRTTICIPIIYD